MNSNNEPSKTSDKTNESVKTSIKPLFKGKEPWVDSEYNINFDINKSANDKDKASTNKEYNSTSEIVSENSVDKFASDLQFISI